MTGTEIATLITAMVGAVALTLSLFNTWVQFSNSRVKLKVIPEIGYKDEEKDSWAVSAIPFPKTMNAVKEKQHRLCVRVINLSNFAVTIQQVGFGKYKLLKDGTVIPFPGVMKKKDCWPLKLESRESDLLMSSTGKDLVIDLLDKNCAYVITECGHIAYGDSHVFDAYVEELKKKRKESEN
ncbi:MAG TPA: hypothetical protein HPP87_06065 [Planctomycetes bacterium]|nr:hypothetical protein [Planctomycetota bacterium]